ncbi:tissue factor pathway inhibitor-like [Dermacentor albipictus]|uniref:tissue factor pathway inhibitor-like n=1 Tax=Dermacentor albipictus TaxID=60249 RepID=UPI0031FE113F
MSHPWKAGKKKILALGLIEEHEIRRKMSTEGSTDVQVQVKEGEKNPCFVCMGVCFLLTVLLVVLTALIVQYVRHNLSTNGTAADGPKCKAALELTACNSETEQYFFHHDPDKEACLVRWLLDAGCLEGKNRFASASECRERCVGNSSDEGARQNPSAECMEPVKAAPCKDEEMKRRDHRYFFEDGNCTVQMGPKCLYGPNRFVSAQECHEFCLDTEEPACRVPRFQGACRMSEKRFVYYYDSSTKACVSWRTPCLAGPNRHESLAGCTETCSRNIFKRLVG